MKFSKVLNRLTSEVPELEDMFLRYKTLKKQIKTIPAQDSTEKAVEGAQDKIQLSSEEEAFVSSLNHELDKFNRFFMEREEEAVIQLQVITERLNKERTSDVLASLVDFHGQAVLLLHWSLLNYAAVAKILKKHDKRTGVLLRAPYLASCLQQPFNSTAILSRLVKQADQLLQAQLPLQPSASRVGGPRPSTGTTATSSATLETHDSVEQAVTLTSTRAPEAAAKLSINDATATTVNNPLSIKSVVFDSALYRRTRLALDVWNTLRSTAATPSTVLAEPQSDVKQISDCNLATLSMGVVSSISNGGSGALPLSDAWALSLQRASTTTSTGNAKEASQLVRERAVPAECAARGVSQGIGSSVDTDSPCVAATADNETQRATGPDCVSRKRKADMKTHHTQSKLPTVDVSAAEAAHSDVGSHIANKRQHVSEAPSSSVQQTASADP